MWSKKTACAATVCMAGVTVIALAATWGAASTSNDGTGEASVVDRLAREMRTNLIREKVKEYGKLIQSRDYDERKEAIDFFHDVRAPHVILLSMQNGSFTIRNYAAAAGCDVACPGDEYVVEKYLVALGDTTAAVSGGTEVKIALQEYRVTVVKTLEHLTDMQLIEGKPVRIPDERVSVIEKAVKKWLESKSRKNDAPGRGNTSPGAM